MNENKEYTTILKVIKYLKDEIYGKTKPLKAMNYASDSEEGIKLEVKHKAIDLSNKASLSLGVLESLMIGLTLDRVLEGITNQMSNSTKLTPSEKHAMQECLEHLIENIIEIDEL
jgi:hypothetical protein